MRESSEPKQPLDFAEARRIVIETVRALPNAYANESTGLEEAYGRVLAENVAADRDYPSLRRSLRDGFAVRIDDLPGVLRVRGEVRAGEETQAPLQAGEALEIMTGAPVPEGADAVVMVEHVERSGDEVKIERTAEPGQFINERGAETQAGGVLMSKGTRLDASHIATLAMVGQVSVRVFCTPRVAILATGDEIVALEEEPAAHQIRNSNSYMLAALVRDAGGMPAILPVARDTPDALRAVVAARSRPRHAAGERRRLRRQVRSGEANSASARNGISLRTRTCAAGTANRIWDVPGQTCFWAAGQSGIVTDHLPVICQTCY